MTSIFEQMTHHHHDQEAPVTTPQMQIGATPAPQRNMLADLSAVLSELSVNQLIARLVNERTGSRLDAAQIEHVIAIVQAFENGHGQVTAPSVQQQLEQQLQQAVTASATGAQAVQ